MPFGGAAGVCSGKGPRLPDTQQPREHPRLSLPHRVRPHSPPAEGLEGEVGLPVPRDGTRCGDGGSGAWGGRWGWAAARAGERALS